MFKITLYRTLVISSILLLIKEGKTQGVLAPAKRDESYIKENAPNRITNIKVDLEHAYYVIDDIFLTKEKFLPYRPSTSGIDTDIVNAGNEFYIPRSFEDYAELIKGNSLNQLTNKQKEFIARITYYRKYYQKPIIPFKECVYFNPSLTALDYIMQKITGRYSSSLPEAFRFYATPICDTIYDGNVYTIKLHLNKPLYEMMQPFYFSKTTITNKEYREFVDWVRDSLAHRILAENDPTMTIYNTTGPEIDPPPINWKTKVNYSDHYVLEKLTDGGLYKPADERFYQRPEIDTRKLNYLYCTVDKNIEKAKFTRHIVNCYPDTLAWINNFQYSSMEPMTNMYFWHPAFDDYPVVGISKEQAQAFLAWKTEQEREKLFKEGKNEWIVTYELPTEYEWEIAETAGKKDGQAEIYPTYEKMMCDYSYRTDLSFKWNNAITPFLSDHKKNLTPTKEIDTAVWTRLFISASTYSLGRSMRRLSGYSNIANDVLLRSDLQKYGKSLQKYPSMDANYDCNGISFMGGNVSEWMQETYKDNWKTIYDYRHKLLEQLGGKDSKLILANEDYFNAMNDTASSSGSASLVRGANWYDDRQGSKAGKNTEGMNAKAFINPDSCYSTIGFRYVIKVYRRDEKKLVDSLQSNLMQIK